MVKDNSLNEALSELKNIPYGKDFSNLLSIYKVVDQKHEKSFAGGYDRKMSDGWNNRGRDSYGIAGYTHLYLSGAKTMLGGWGGYGSSIIKIKLLGGLKNFIFFNTDQDNEIKRLQIENYGKPMSVYEQLLTLTGDSALASRYAHCSPSDFGRRAQHEIRKQGYYIRGMICDYWNDTRDIVVYPFNFGDMIVCAVASNLDSSMSTAEIEKRFVGTMDQELRNKQNGFLDIVPHLEMVGALDPDGGQYIRLNGKAYAPYETSRREYNILIIDDENWVSPKDEKMFPKEVRLDAMPSQISSRGNFSFSMNGIPFQANVLGMANGEQLTPDQSPIFAAKGSDQWFAWENLQYAYENPDWVKQELLGNLNEGIEEAFRQGMSFDEFVNNNKAFGYVCVHKDSVKGILEHGFSREYAAENDANYNGGRGFYGNGVYGCVTLGLNASPDKFRSNADMKNAGASRLSYYTDYSKSDGLKYGGVILKCSIVGGWNNFLILDKELAQKIYKGDYSIERQINDIVGSKNPSDAQALINAMRCYEGFRYEVTDSDSRTTPPLAKLFRGTMSEFSRWETFFRKYGIRGAVYHGGNDGYGFVCYNYAEVVPVGVSYDHGETFVTNEIDWEKTHDRLLYGGDPKNKLGHKYRNVSSFPKRVSIGEVVFGVVNVEKNNGKFNCVRMDTLKELFPIDFDIEPTISIRGSVNFRYRGHDFKGSVYNAEADGPSFVYDGSEYSINDIDAVIDYYIDGNNGGYEEVEGDANQQQIQENFFRLLDKLERL